MKSCLYSGKLRHRRFEPVSHAFDYSVFMFLLDLDEIDMVFDGRWLWSSRRASLARFERRDHLGDPNVPLHESVRRLVDERTGARPTGPIRLLTQLRYFGYGFNPVSFYYCYDRTGSTVETVVAEINNTPWGEQHCYVLGASSSPRDTTGELKHYELSKEFHISPFMPMDLRYRWRFTSPGGGLVVHMENQKDERKLFDATLHLRREPITGWTLNQKLITYPLASTAVIARIYWQALRLWLKKCPVYTHPRSEAVHPLEGTRTR